MVFSGSYAADDVQLLLKPVRCASTDIVEKERLIQSGTKHYSELLSRESPPTDEYLALFKRAVEVHRRRLGRDIAKLARRLVQRPGKTVAIVSFARAGTPIGVLLRRAVARLGRTGIHYSISIIRDRGIDAVALDYILARHDASELAFVDGWIGKGAIAREFSAAIAEYNRSRRTRLADKLYVVADLAGYAEFAATSDDYLIPSSILNATVSGLVSRTILNSECVGQNDFHACVYYHEFASIDLSRWFVDELMHDVDAAIAGDIGEETSWTPEGCARLRQTAADAVAWACRTYDLGDANRVKPGIGETTRALLRRAPSRILLRDLDVDDVAHLLWLARRRRIPVEHVPQLPYRAVAIIETLGND